MKKTLLIIPVYCCVIFFFCFAQTRLCAQDLGKIARVTLTQGSMADSVSFILAPVDFNAYKNDFVKSASSLQIIDAATPWPPRWYFSYRAEPRPKGEFNNVIVDASFQNDQITFYTLVISKTADDKTLYRPGYVFYNKNFLPTDTFKGCGQGIDAHELLLQKGERLFFGKKDTVVNARQLLQSPTDTALAIMYEPIEICDAKGKLLFNWDPIASLGLDAVYPDYLRLNRVMADKDDAVDWSHGNSLYFDYDGNILYSYKYIGIGKISRKDGHLMWRVDRNKPQPNSLSDIIPVYLQHDLRAIKDASGEVVYTFFSNGDKQNPSCSAIQFTVKEIKDKQVFKIKKKIVPQTPQVVLSGGNYDVEANENSLISYGLPAFDTVKAHLAFEYRDKNDKVVAQYFLPPTAISYRIHKFSGFKPSRPAVEAKDGLLSVDKRLEDCTWFQLSGPENKLVKEVGHGVKFKPSGPGSYCVQCRYGMGYAVSLPANFTK